MPILIKRDIKTILINRSYYKKELDNFVYQLDSNNYGKLQQIFQDLENCFITKNELELYTILASKNIKKQTKSLNNSNNKLGIRYIPNAQLVYNSLNYLGNCKEVILEALAGGFFPKYLLPQITNKHSNIYLNPAYKEIENQKHIYIASGSADELKRCNIIMQQNISSLDHMFNA